MPTPVTSWACAQPRGALAPNMYLPPCMMMTMNTSNAMAGFRKMEGMEEPARNRNTITMGRLLLKPPPWYLR